MNVVGQFHDKVSLNDVENSASATNGNGIKYDSDNENITWNEMNHYNNESKYINEVTFYVSQDLNIPFKVKLNSLEGFKTLLKPSEKILHPELCIIQSNVNTVSELIASVQIFNSDTEQILTLPEFTPYIQFQKQRKWDFTISLPILINQLNLNSKLRIILWEFNGYKKIPFYKIETFVFDQKDNTLKRGLEAIKFDITQKDHCSIITDNKHLNNLNKYLRGEMKAVDWLDKVTLPLIEKQLFKSLRDLPKNTFVLNIEYPTYELPVVYTDRLTVKTQNNPLSLANSELNSSMLQNNYKKNNTNGSNYNRAASKIGSKNEYNTQSVNNTNTGNNTVNNNTMDTLGAKISTGTPYKSTLKFYDPDQYNTDPIEEKYRRLERTTKSTSLDRNLKPDAKKRDYLNKIINYPPGTTLTAHEKGSIWKYRYFLVNNRKALTKLLKSTNLNEEGERTEVLDLMDSWVEIGIDDTIELLGSEYKNISIRAYAVNRLKKATDKELELYLLQLVQAVCFESLTTLTDESNNEYSIVNINSFKNNISNQKKRETENNAHNNKNTLNSDSILKDSEIVISPLAEFLIRRALKNLRLGTYFYWYLKAELADNPSLNNIIESYYARLSSEGRLTLDEQLKFIDILRDCCIQVKKLKDSTKKNELAQHLLSSKLRNHLKRHHVVLPLNPDITVVDVDPEGSRVFKSSLSPLKINLKGVHGEHYSMMFKVGDDLRQDQLIVQIISLMNELLKNENVDLKLLTYKILATNSQEGAIEFIPNETMATILSSYNGIRPYFKAHNFDANESSGVKQVVMDTFVKSCAGYSVITYLLGVGDRHLDNLLITPDGHFFHADFGYVLGQDPKPFPPLMKLPPQIIEAFGGIESANFDKFRSYCFVAYSILRRNAGLILNLFELMKTSNIPDIRIDPEGAVQKVKERFNLDMSEEEATIHFQTLINDSVSAILPIVIDHLHNLAQYWRA
ncbi:hypothetical protein TPHA_0C02310 [Tetrapisispora phaffii CBS 4417]|uniref:Phosphatidylinositol 3-kinase VPS34 n=1 Tax=Tetrapisispora phaffii (strain ATCC 24235 / CBS 4417 / NBRC 1672 / NRRL Y-8282 / UCD 70-5) TaxID=1071381 RepID=G8BRK8_TETPH|nr:hypothetical protein TPHA_0C02310 [Tetrapisispora phaffii CBS 4417]CCE62384.1 hypothetical protein TPHA_0C02310 [Tetrapisispora phaffii CBS 4417]